MRYFHNFELVWKVRPLMKIRKYIIIEPNGDISRWLFSELESSPDVDILYKPWEIDSVILRYFRKIHFSHKINSFIELPFKNIWDRYYTLSQYNFGSEFDYVIIIGNFAINQFDLDYLEKIRENYEAKIVLLFTDPVCSEHALRAYEKTKHFVFDLVLTFDPNDAQKYHFVYTGPLYSFKPMKNEKAVRDVFFVGVDKNRLNILRTIYDKLNRNGAKCDFFVAGVKKKDIKDDGLIYNQRCSYEEVVARLQTYNVILDVVQEGQAGASFRYFEAVCYNKKLLTNNPNVKNLPFYSPDNICVFSDVNDIDPDWIFSPAVNYGYNGEFSPYHLLSKIDDMF